MSEQELSAEETRTIRELTKLAQKWPKTLWLYANGVNIYVMRVGENGERFVTGFGKGYDPDCSVATIGIPNDGGDW